MSDTHRVEIGDAVHGLLEAAFNLRLAHVSALYSRVEVTTGAELHHFAPVPVLVLHQVDRLDDVDVVEGGGDAELRSELLDVLLFRFVLATFSEFLKIANEVRRVAENRRLVRCSP